MLKRAQPLPVQGHDRAVLELDNRHVEIRRIDAHLLEDSRPADGHRLQDAVHLGKLDEDGTVQRIEQRAKGERLAPRRCHHGGSQHARAHGSLQPRALAAQRRRLRGRDQIAIQLA